MQNLIFSLNATLPIFLLMLFGVLLKHIGIIDEPFTNYLNKFVFKIALPVVLFNDLSQQDFAACWNGRFLFFCFAATFISISIITIIAHFAIKDPPVRGEFIQASYRSSAALLGIAFIQNIYGDGNSGMAPLMILGSVPLYNICAVIILSVTSPSNLSSASANTIGKVPSSSSHLIIHRTIKGILTNPIIIGIATGFVFSIFSIPQPHIINKVLGDIGALATPLGLMAMGASFDYKKTMSDLKPVITASFIKLFLLPFIFLFPAMLLGFRDQEIIAILVMLGSASTVSCYIMARNMGHAGVVTSGTVLMTTFGCSFSLTFWIYILRVLHLC